MACLVGVSKGKGQREIKARETRWTCQNILPRVLIARVNSPFFLSSSLSTQDSCSAGNRVFSHEITAAILVSQNNETAAMLVSQTNPLGVELFCYANAFFCSNKLAKILAT